MVSYDAILLAGVIAATTSNSMALVAAADHNRDHPEHRQLHGGGGHHKNWDPPHSWHGDWPAESSSSSSSSSSSGKSGKSGGGSSGKSGKSGGSGSSSGSSDSDSGDHHGGVGKWGAPPNWHSGWGKPPSWHGGWPAESSSSSSSSSGKSGKSGGGSKGGKSGYSSSSSSSSSSSHDGHGGWHGGWGKPDHHHHGQPPSWHGGWPAKPDSSSRSSSSSSGKSGKSGNGKSGKSGGSKGGKSGYSSSSSSSSSDSDSDSDDHHGHWAWVGHGGGPSNGGLGGPGGWDSDGWSGSDSISSSSSSSSSGKSGKSGGSGSGKSGKSGGSSDSSSSDSGSEDVDVGGKWTDDGHSETCEVGATCSKEGSRCTEGTETCCGETFDSFVCDCANDGEGSLKYMCFYTDACLAPSCEKTSEDKLNDDNWDGDGWTGDSHTGDSEEWDGDGHLYNHVTDYCHASCDGNVCTYTALVDLFASEFGFLTFEECDENSPTITMEVGKTYKFIQKDVTNYFHPLGFAYGPDGFLAGAERLEQQYLSYQLDGDDIGLNEYGPAFTHPIEEWATDGEYIVYVTLPKDISYTKDLFYFCHIHQYLGGRIKLTRNGKLLQPHAQLPIHNRLPPPQSDYDEHCGTFGLVHSDATKGWQGDTWPHSMTGDHRLPHPECPHTFICTEDKSIFASCLDAINCHMFNGMTTYERNSEVGLFLHQMIPHHQNAVNMAKSLLLHWDYDCDPEDLGDDTNNECIMENIIRSIINAQNGQIQTMRGLLASKDIPEFDDCDVPIMGSVESSEKGSGYVYGPWYGWGDDGHPDGGHGQRRGLGEDGICRASCSTKNGHEVCQFTVGVDLNAADLGAFYFEECGSDNTYPVIGIEVGKSYIFVQGGRSNYYHPLGFAYGPDGAHAGNEEVEDEYLTYRVDREDIGLDGYEPLFFHSPAEWTEYGTFSVELNYNKDYDQDLFYFCHIHNFMSGRIKLLKNDKPIQPANTPKIKYSHPEPSPYDKSCGTFGLAPFQLPHPECPSKFVCDKQSHFGECIDTMNCFMMVGMTTYADKGNDGDVALFNHQMIPHHENAVNMAKALLKTGVIHCASLADNTDDCAIENILREIINNQNYQIQLMYEVLKDDGFPKTNDCVVTIKNHGHKLRK